MTLRQKILSRVNVRDRHQVGLWLDDFEIEQAKQAAESLSSIARRFLQVDVDEAGIFSVTENFDWVTVVDTKEAGARIVERMSEPYEFSYFPNCNTELMLGPFEFAIHVLQRDRRDRNHCLFIAKAENGK